MVEFDGKQHGGDQSLGIVGTQNLLLGRLAKPMKVFFGKQPFDAVVELFECPGQLLLFGRTQAKYYFGYRFAHHLCFAEACYIFHAVVPVQHIAQAVGHHQAVAALFGHRAEQSLTFGQRLGVFSGLGDVACHHNVA